VVSISACMIVRDEERVLERCLESIAGAYDELCIVDTGSRDHTPFIAQQARAKFRVLTNWNDADGRIADFAATRNSALEMATGDWVLWIDADEVLIASGAQRIRRCVLRRDVAGISVVLKSGGARWSSVRIFRRSPSVRFVGRIHEWVELSGLVVSEPRIVIRNKPDKIGKESSASRDLRLCTAALAANPNDTRMILYLARALQNTGAYFQAVEYYDLFLRLETHFKPGRHFVTHNTAVCHLLCGKWKEALRWGQKALRIDNAKPESHCVVGDAHLALGHSDRARRCYCRALECVPPAADYPMFVSNSFYHHWPKQRLRRFFGYRG
jgi:glycosyltransferase involved in cell wall biosynthesis